jgi:hypothetical protein
MNTVVPILTVTEVAALMQCAESTVETHARAGNVPALRWGDGGWVFPAQALYNRLNELAIEQAVERRKPPDFTAVIVANRKRARRELPVLSSLDFKP